MFRFLYIANLIRKLAHVVCCTKQRVEVWSDESRDYCCQNCSRSGRSLRLAAPRSASVAMAGTGKRNQFHFQTVFVILPRSAFSPEFPKQQKNNTNLKLRENKILLFDQRTRLQKNQRLSLLERFSFINKARLIGRQINTNGKYLCI